MLKFGRKTDEPQNEVKSSDKEGKGSWFKENQRSIIAVALIAVMAFVMRFIFAFGVSADNAFALSGGVAASEHLHTITEMLTDGSFFGSDSSLNYPFGSVNSNPILIDGVLALIASIGTSLGMATVKAASLTLATFSVVCGTLAVIPMFLLGKEVIGTKKAPEYHDLTQYIVCDYYEYSIDELDHVFIGERYAPLKNIYVGHRCRIRHFGDQFAYPQHQI